LLGITLNGSSLRKIKISSGRYLTASPVFDTYWRFASKRQQVFYNRLAGGEGPWTDDPIISAHRFTNVFRASDRVSQYLIKNVIYSGNQDPIEVFFRTLLFKLFNKIETWELLLKELKDELAWRSFDLKRYSAILDKAINAGDRIYSAAYIMPSPAFGHPRKHKNHLALLQKLMRERLCEKIASAKSLESVFNLLLQVPSFGGFLAFQFAIDLNYSEICNFSEMDFVVAGPGAKSGIKKCFVDTAHLSEADVIRAVTEMAPQEFERLGLVCPTLWGRDLQLIDCQNLFCETDKYARVAHPEWAGESGRTKIKQKFVAKSHPQ